MAKSEQRILARNLRDRGRSIKSIAKELNVSQGSVSLWCKDIVLTKEQIATLEKNYRDPFYGGRLENALKQQRIRVEKTNRLRLEGEAEIGRLSKRELLIAGTALYWAEGYKKDSQAGLGSSDPAMMQLYVRWLRECFGCTFEDLLFRITINRDHEYRINQITSFWANLMGVGLDRFQKPFYQNVKWKKVYENPGEYFGVLRIRVRRSSDLLRKIHGYISGLKQNVDRV